MERPLSSPKWWEKSPLEVTKYITLVQIPGIDEGPDLALKLAHKVEIHSSFISTTPWEEVQKIAWSLTECGFNFLPSSEEDGVVLGRKEPINPPEEKPRINVLKEIEDRKRNTGEGSPPWMNSLPH